MRHLAVFAFALFVAAPALAQDPLPPAVEKYFYCAEEIFWFGEGVGNDTGDAEKQAKYDHLADLYNLQAQKGVDGLIAAGWTSAEAENAVFTFSDEVTAAWASNGPFRYALDECLALR